MLSPQIGSLHSLVQSSSLTMLPSSQPSKPSCVPLPHISPPLVAVGSTSVVPVLDEVVVSGSLVPLVVGWPVLVSAGLVVLPPPLSPQARTRSGTAKDRASRGRRMARTSIRSPQDARPRRPRQA